MKKLILGAAICTGMALASCAGHTNTSKATDSPAARSGTDTATIANDSSHMASQADTMAKTRATTIDEKTGAASADTLPKKK